MEHLDSIWDLNEAQLKMSGFSPFQAASLEGLVNDDIWKRDVIVAESKFNDAIIDYQKGKELNIFVGYAPGKAHLGYIIMNRILRSFRNDLDSNLVLGINLAESMQTHNKTFEETIAANKVVENVLLGENKKNLTRIHDVSHLNDADVQRNYEELYSEVLQELSPFDFRKTMGWDEKHLFFNMKVYVEQFQECFIQTRLIIIQIH